MFKELIKLMIKNGGGTLKNNKLVEFEDGYIIAFKEFEKVINMDESVFECLELLEEYVNKHNDSFIGFWVNDGKLYLDVVQNISNYHMAILEGLKQNQKAIWDVKNGKEIWLG